MRFLKNFFDDETTIVGLCGFDEIKPKYPQRTVVSESFFNHFSTERKFETNFYGNVLLKV
jgi:hypothetical protein